MGWAWSYIQVAYQHRSHYVSVQFLTDIEILAREPSAQARQPEQLGLDRSIQSCERKIFCDIAKGRGSSGRSVDLGAA
jgi:hypothetical protein